MRTLGPTGEDEVIACFLRAESASPRWGGALHAMLLRDGKPHRIISAANLADTEEGASYRRRLLAEFRGWRDRLLFVGFPSEIAWSRVSVTPDELMEVQYIDWAYWRDLSGGTRLPRVAATRIRAGQAEEDRRSYEEVEQLVRAGDELPELIAVTGTGMEPGRIVLVEGHARLTGYALAEKSIPAEVPLYLGRSAEISRWRLY